MTVGAAVPPAFYNGDGVLTQFIIPWTVRNTAYVEAGWVDSAGLWVAKINGTDYSVAFSGGSWRLTFTAPPPAGVNNVVIRRVTPGQQGVAFRDLRRFPAENTEAMGDLLAEAAQDLSTQLLTVFRLAPADHGKLRVMDTLQNAVGKFWTISADPGNPGGFRVDFSPSVAAVEATAAIAAQIVQVAAASASIVIVAQPTNIAGIVTLAPQAANVALLGPVAAQIGVLGTAPNPANMATLAPVAGNITTVATNIAAVNSLAGQIASPTSNFNLIGDDLALGAGSFILNSLTRATEAAASATLAGQFANHPVDTDIPGQPAGTKSGNHHRVKAEEYQFEALTHRIGAELAADAATDAAPPNFADLTAAIAGGLGEGDAYYNTTFSDFRVITVAPPDPQDEDVLRSMTGAEKTFLGGLIAGDLPGVLAASQTEAEDGLVNDKAMTPLRVAQAIAVLSPATVYASQAEATALSAANRTLSPAVAAFAVFATGALGNSFAVDAEGATLGGGADATAALAATIAKIPTATLYAGGEVFVGGGTYPTTAALTLPDYARVKGVTPSSSRLDFAGLAGTGGAILDTTQSYYLGVSNIAIDNPPGYAIDWNDTSSGRIEDVEIRPRATGATSGGVRLRERSYLTTVDRVRVIDSRAIAFVADNPSTGVNTSLVYRNNYAHGSQASGYFKSALVYSLDECNAADDCLEWGYVYENMNCHVALANGVERSTMAPLRLRTSTAIADQCSIAASKDLRNLTFIGVFASDCGDGSTHPTFADIQALDGRVLNATFINCYTDNVGGGGSPVGIRVDGSQASAFILGNAPGGSIDLLNGAAAGRYGFNGQHEWDIDGRLSQFLAVAYSGVSPTRTRQLRWGLEVDGAGLDRNQGAVSGGYSTFETDVYSGGASWHASYFTARRSRGSKASPVVINANDTLFVFDIWGRGSGGWARASQILFAQDNAAPGGTLRGTISFDCSNNTASPEKVLQLFSDKSSRFFGNAIPNVTGTQSLGTSALRWDLFADAIDAQSLLVTGAPASATLTNSRNDDAWASGQVISEIVFRTLETNGIGAHDTGFIRNVADTGNNTTPAGALVFGVAPFNTAAAEAMRLTSAGKLDLIGPFEFRPSAAETPTDNGDVVFDVPSNTQFRIRHRGSDGTIRSNTLTLA